MALYIYIDDIRSDDKFFKHTFDYLVWNPVICRTYDEAIKVINENCENTYLFLDLDHDLSEEKTGYDICKYVVEHNIPLTGFHIHSMNNVGVENMRQLLSHYGYEEF